MENRERERGGEKCKDLIKQFDWTWRRRTCLNNERLHRVTPFGPESPQLMNQTIRKGS